MLLEGLWSAAPAAGNPGGSDQRRALARKGLVGRMKVRPFDGLVVLRREAGCPWLASLLRVKRRWRQLLVQTWPPDDAGLLRSLLLGERVALEERLQDAFIRTGTIQSLATQSTKLP